MKVFTTFLFMLLASTVLAQPPTYNYTRERVIEQNQKCQIPEAERIFVKDECRSSFIVRFRDGITLREIVDQANYKDEGVSVIVLRSGSDTPFRWPFWGTVMPAEKPTFSLKPGDVVLLNVCSW